MRLPDVEPVAAAVHEAWMATKRAQGVTTRRSETGEELMVPYAELSEAAKELDRGTVRAVYAGIAAAIAPEPVTPDAEAWVVPEPKPSYPRLTGVRAAGA